MFDLFIGDFLRRSNVCTPVGDSRRRRRRRREPHGFEARPKQIKVCHHHLAPLSARVCPTMRTTTNQAPVGQVSQSIAGMKFFFFRKDLAVAQNPVSTWLGAEQHFETKRGVIQTVSHPRAFLSDLSGNMYEVIWTGSVPCPAGYHQKRDH